MRQQDACLSEIGGGERGSNHLPLQLDASDVGGQVTGDFIDQHPSIYCPQKSASKDAAMCVRSKGQVRF